MLILVVQYSSGRILDSFESLLEASTTLGLSMKDVESLPTLLGGMGTEIKMSYI